MSFYNGFSGCRRSAALRNTAKPMGGGGHNFLSCVMISRAMQVWLPLANYWRSNNSRSFSAMDIIVDNWKKREHIQARYSKHKWSPLPSSQPIEFDNAGDNISVKSIILQPQRSIGDFNAAFSSLLAPLMLANQRFITNYGCQIGYEYDDQLWR